jgi:hypothetical protein
MNTNKDFNFVTTVRAMPIADIVHAMVAGLNRRWVKVNMTSFGHVDEDGTCYGCAATNAICQIKGQKIGPEYLVGDCEIQHARFLGLGDTDDNVKFVGDFESAIDCLRQGGIRDYNKFARKHKFAILPEFLETASGYGLINLPYLTNDDYSDKLYKYEYLVSYLEHIEFTGLEYLQEKTDEAEIQ